VEDAIIIGSQRMSQRGMTIHTEQVNSFSRSTPGLGESIVIWIQKKSPAPLGIPERRAEKPSRAQRVFGAKARCDEQYSCFGTVGCGRLVGVLARDPMVGNPACLERRIRRKRGQTERQD
jgi:hypothetical protein